jgi:hypothetical protein
VGNSDHQTPQSCYSSKTPFSGLRTRMAEAAPGRSAIKVGLFAFLVGLMPTIANALVIFSYNETESQNFSVPELVFTFSDAFLVEGAQGEASFDDNGMVFSAVGSAANLISIAGSRHVVFGGFSSNCPLGSCIQLEVSGDEQILNGSFIIGPGGADQIIGANVGGGIWEIGFGTDNVSSVCFGPADPGETPCFSRGTFEGRVVDPSPVPEPWPMAFLPLLLGFVVLVGIWRPST